MSNPLFRYSFNQQKHKFEQIKVNQHRIFSQVTNLNQIKVNTITLHPVCTKHLFSRPSKGAKNYDEKFT